MFLILLCFSCRQLNPALPVVIDGNFTEWQKIKNVLFGPPDLSDAYVNFADVRLTNDKKNIYLFLNVGNSVNLQSLDGTFSILLDTDGDKKTGGTFGTFSGVDLIFDFSPPRFFGENVSFLGAAARHITKGPDSSNVEKAINIYETGFVHAPTFASSKFEMSVNRRIRLYDGIEITMEKDVHGQLVFSDLNGVKKDRTDIFHYTMLDSPAEKDTSQNDLIARKNKTDFRIVAWNISDQAILTQPAGFSRILTALNPDVIMLDEVSSVCKEADIFAILPEKSSGEKSDWHIVFGKGGGYQHGVIASHLPLEMIEAFQFLPYSPELLKTHIEKITDSKRLSNEKYHVKHGIATVAAAVTLLEKRIMLVTIDLQSRGRFDSPEEAKRILEAQTIKQAVSKELSNKVYDALIIAGDLNLVGGEKPLQILKAYYVPLNSNLKECSALSLDGKSNFTWYNSRDIFLPGRLDYMLYNDSGLQPLNSFVFNSYKLENKWLEYYDLQRENSGNSSDHLPIVTDFKIIN